MHFRHDRIGAAEREQRHDRELHRERDQNVGIRLHRRIHQASATLDRRQHDQHPEQRPAHEADRKRRGQQHERRRADAAEHRRRHLRHRGDDEAGGGRRDAAEHAAHGIDIAVALIEHPAASMTQNGTSRNPAQAASAPVGTAHARAEHRGEVDDVGAGQELAERVDVVEFLRRHPALLLDEHAPRPGQRPAEAGQRDFEEGEEEVGVAGDRRWTTVGRQSRTWPTDLAASRGLGQSISTGK